MALKNRQWRGRKREKNEKYIFLMYEIVSVFVPLPHSTLSCLLPFFISDDEKNERKIIKEEETTRKKVNGCVLDTSSLYIKSMAQQQQHWIFYTEIKIKGGWWWWWEESRYSQMWE